MRPGERDARRRSLGATASLGAFIIACGAIVASGGCHFDDPYRQAPVEAGPPICTLGAVDCHGAKLVTCAIGPDGEPAWVTTDDCSARGETCVSPTLGCRVCLPNSTSCAGPDGERVDTCRADGSGYDPGAECTAMGFACRAGACEDLCALAATQRSNVGCEYWGAQLDNANISPTLNATAQQYAIVVSNPQPDVSANVVVTVDDAEPGMPASLRVVEKATVHPLDLAVFKLGPRWVNGQTDVAGTGATNSALSRHAFRVTANVPIIAFEFNPLDNVNVFSNDASLLKPVEAIGDASSYVVVGWPQTIANDPDPNKNFGLDLRSTLSIIGTRDATSVTVKTTAAIVAGGAVPAVPAGGTLTWTLAPFEVLNLESGAFGADFTGSTVTASHPVVVFSGSQAADAPHWTALASRYCCADHLESQLDPVRTAGRRYVVARSPNRSRAVAAAGASSVGAFDEPEYVRIVAAVDGVTTVQTTLDPPNDRFTLSGVGDFREIEFHRDFAIASDGALHLGQLQSSQDASGVPRGLPGGDPSLMVLPSVEQYRSDYVFLTPDKYIFDFFTVVAPAGTTLLFDGAPLPSDACEKASAKPASDPTTGAPVSGAWDVYRCQLSFPTIDLTQPSGMQVGPGRQNDGVHHLQASFPVLLTVYGFDNYVSYAYAGGTNLTELTPR
jgi:hypothetical protein